MSTLQDRRAALTAEIATLERQQGAAVLDGKAFDAKPLIAAREALEALDTAEAEQSRRDREAEAARSSKEIGQARKDARETLTVYLAALDRVKATTEALAADLTALQEHGGKLAPLALRLGGASSAWLIEKRECALAVSRQMAAILAPLGRTFGEIEWPTRPLKPDWDAHARQVRSIINPLIGDVE